MRMTRRGVMAGLAVGAAGRARAAEAPLVIQAGSSVPSIVYLPIYVAQQAGFFARENVAVDLRYTNGGPLAVQLVANGNADLAHIVWQPAIQASQRGAKGRFVYGTYTRSSFFLAVPAAGPVKGPADLAGKRVGVFNMASPGVFLTRSMLRGAGLKADAVTFYPVGLGAQALAALSSGQVDVLALWDSEYANYAAAGQDLRYIHHPVLGPIGNGGFYASDASIASRKPAMAGFCRALAEGTAYLLANPESALRMYWKTAPATRPQGPEADAVRQGLAGLKFTAQTFDIQNRPDHRFGAIDPAGLQRFIDAMHDEGEIPASIPAASLIDDEFIAGANQFDHEAVVKPV